MTRRSTSDSPHECGDRYNVFGSLPDVIEDDWIDDIENLPLEGSSFEVSRSGSLRLNVPQ